MLTQTREKAESARDQLIEKARVQAEREAANLNSAAERERRDALAAMQEDIVALPLATASGILEKLADSDVDARLWAQLLQELDALKPRDGGPSRRAPAGTQAPVRVVSARPLDEEARRQIAQRIEALRHAEATVEFVEDVDLIAGATVEFSDMAVDSSLRGALASVRERIDELSAEQQPASGKSGDEQQEGEAK